MPVAPAGNSAPGLLQRSPHSQTLSPCESGEAKPRPQPGPGVGSRPPSKRISSSLLPTATGRAGETSQVGFLPHARMNLGLSPEERVPDDEGALSKAKPRHDWQHSWTSLESTQLCWNAG